MEHVIAGQLQQPFKIPFTEEPRNVMRNFWSWRTDRTQYNTMQWRNTWRRKKTFAPNFIWIQLFDFSTIHPLYDTAFVLGPNNIAKLSGRKDLIFQEISWLWKGNIFWRIVKLENIEYVRYDICEKGMLPYHQCVIWNMEHGGLSTPNGCLHKSNLEILNFLSFV